MFNLKGRVAVISGASSGLGRQMARAFANQGADLVILARRFERLEELKRELEPLNVRVLPIMCDVTSTDDISNAAKAGLISITPANTGEYKFYSVSDIDTYVTLYSEDEMEITSDDDSGDNYNFCLTYTFEGGRTYYFETWPYGDSNAQFKVKLERASSFNFVGGDEENIYVTCPVSEPITLNAEVANYSGEEPTYTWFISGETVSTGSPSYEFTPYQNELVECEVSCGDDTKRKYFNIRLNHFNPSESYTQQETAEFGDTVIMWANVYADIPESLHYEWSHLVDGEDETIDGALCRRIWRSGIYTR